MTSSGISLGTFRHETIQDVENTLLNSECDTANLIVLVTSIACRALVDIGIVW